MRTLIKCLDCGKTVSINANKCPHCGSVAFKASTVIAGVLNAGVVLVVIGWLLWSCVL